MTTEMNRRAKFLTVEGIQKRKNPDKNYVSKVIVVPFLSLMKIKSFKKLSKL